MTLKLPRKDHTMENTEIDTVTLLPLMQQPLQVGQLIKKPEDVTRIVQQVRGSSATSGQKEDTIYRLVKAFLEHYGKFYVADTGQLYWFETARCLLLPMSGEDFRSRLSLLLDISPVGHLFRNVAARLESYARQYGVPVQPRFLSHYDATNNLVYLDQHNGRMLILDGKDVHSAPNGESGILFVSDSSWEPWNYVATTETDEMDFDRLLFDGNYDESQGVFTNDEAKAMLSFWLYGLAFKNYCHGFPIVLMTGPAGSGKTYGCRMALQFMLGRKAQVSMIDPRRSEDLDTLLTNQPLVALDNVDGKIPWLANKMAVAATGGTISRRLLYTTNQVVSFPVVGGMMVTSREPKFIRDDTVERIIPLTLHKRNEYVGENQSFEEMLSHRDRLQSVYVNRLNKAVAVIAQRGFPRGIRTTRMAEFQSLSMVMAAALLPEGFDVDAVFRKLKLAQARQLGEQDAFLSVLVEALGTENLNKEMSATELAQMIRKSPAYRTSSSRWSMPEGVVGVGKAISQSVDALREVYGLNVKARHTNRGNFYTFTEGEPDI